MKNPNNICLAEQFYQCKDYSGSTLNHIIYSSTEHNCGSTKIVMIFDDNSVYDERHYVNIFTTVEKWIKYLHKQFDDTKKTNLEYKRKKL